MDQIRSGLFLGDVTDTYVAKLDEHGITAVLSCMSADERIFVKGPRDRKWVLLGILDGEPIPFPKLEQAMEQLDEWAENEETILVHCAAGISRSPGVLIAYLMSFGASWDDVLHHIRKVRPQAAPLTEIKESILQYYRWSYEGGHAP